MRCLYEASNRRDYANAVQCLDPQVEVYPAVVGLDPAGAGTTRRWFGRNGVLQTFEDLGETWQSVTVEIQGTRNAHVLVLRPGANPLQRLADVLARLTPTPGAGHGASANTRRILGLL